MDFCVVEFQESLDMLVVHASWLVGESYSYCPPYWANSAKLRKAVIKGEPPNEETWVLYPARILKRSESYEHALKLLKEAETANTSEIGIDRPLGRGCRRATQRRLSESSSNSDEAQTRNVTPKKRKTVSARGSYHQKLPSPPPPPALHLTQHNIPIAVEQEPSFTFGPLLLEEPVGVLQADRQNAIAGAVRVESPASSLTSSISPVSSVLFRENEMNQTLRPGTIKQVLLQLSVINAKLDAQGEMLAIIVNSRDKAAINDDGSSPYTLPLESSEELEALEALIKLDSAEKKKLIQRLSTAGGATPNDTTYRIMERLMTNELALQHSWAGLKGKIPFGGLTIMTTICEAVKRNPLAKNPTDLDVENAVKYWLKRAMNRIKAAQAAAEKKKSSV